MNSPRTSLYRDSATAEKIKAVLVTYNKPPFSVLTLKKNGISKPKDLEGKILGAPAADAAYSHWPIFASINGIDSSTMTIENVGFPVRETLLAQGQVDAVTAFISNILALKAMGIPEDETVGMMMADYGVDLDGKTVNHYSADYTLYNTGDPAHVEYWVDPDNGFVWRDINHFKGATETIVEVNAEPAPDMTLPDKPKQ